MYTIEKKNYGLHITMGGRYADGEIEKYVEEKEDALRDFDNGYCLLVDLRAAIPPEAADADLLGQSQARSRDGLIRQALVVHSPVLRLRANQLIVSGPIKDRTRIISSSQTPNWEEVAMKWILYGKEPAANETWDPDHVDQSESSSRT